MSITLFKHILIRTIIIALLIKFFYLLTSLST